MYINAVAIGVYANLIQGDQKVSVNLTIVL